MRSYDELVDEAAHVDVSGWDFSWLDGRAVEERPGWGYAGLLATALSEVGSGLDLQTGGGEVVDSVARLPDRMAVTEGWPPNAAAARNRGPPACRRMRNAGRESRGSRSPSVAARPCSSW